MSHENVEVVRKSYQDWKRGDLDAVVETLDDDVVFRTAEGWPERVFHGKAAVRSFLEGYAETVGNDTVIEDLIDAGGVVVARVRARLTGGRSGIEGEQHYTQVTTVRGGKSVLIEY
jgi:ketosteroid isomerase-like protein